ncbi:MAG: folate-binding protein [Pseudomonadota bacterium]
MGSRVDTQGSPAYLKAMQSRFAYLPHRTVLALNGPDTIDMLERLITSTTTDWPVGDARPGALLTPQGKIIADFLAIRTGEGVLLDIHRDAVEDLSKRLKLFRLRAKVDIEPLENAIVVAGIEPAEHGVRPVSGAQLVYIDPRYPGGRLRAMADKTEWRQYHGHEAEWSLPASDHDLDRIVSGIPEWGFDYRAAEVFPADVNLDRLGGVDYKKGCFVGQEVVSRMYRRGKIRKRTFLVTGEALSQGAAFEADQALGVITSVSGERGLCLLRLDRFARAELTGHQTLCNGSPADLLKCRQDWMDEEIREAYASD